MLHGEPSLARECRLKDAQRPSQGSLYSAQDNILSAITYTFVSVLSRHRKGSQSPPGLSLGVRTPILELSRQQRLQHVQEAFWTRVLEGRSPGGEGGHHTIQGRGGILLAWISFSAETITFLKLRLHEKASVHSHKPFTLGPPQGHDFSSSQMKAELQVSRSRVPSSTPDSLHSQLCPAS